MPLPDDLFSVPLTPIIGDPLADYGQCHFSWVVHSHFDRSCRPSVPSFQNRQMW